MYRHLLLGVSVLLFVVGYLGAGITVSLTVSPFTLYIVGCVLAGIAIGGWIIEYTPLAEVIEKKLAQYA